MMFQNFRRGASKWKTDQYTNELSIAFHAIISRGRDTM